MCDQINIFHKKKTYFNPVANVINKLYNSIATPKKTNLLEYVPTIFRVRFSAMAGMDLGNEKQMSTNVATKVILCHRDIFTYYVLT